MKTYTPQPYQLMSWQDVKDWLHSMNEKELAQPAFVYTRDHLTTGGNHTNEEKIVGTKTKRLNTEFEAPRLIGESSL